VAARRRAAPSAFIVLGSSATALALGRRIHAAGCLAVHVDTEDRPGDIATRSRMWAQKHRAARGPATRELLMRIAAEHDGPTRPYLVGTGDEDLWFIAAHRAELDVRFDVLHPPNEAMVTCLDKARFLGFCDANGLPAPSWFVTRGTADAVRRGVPPGALPLVARVTSRQRGPSAFPKMFRLDTRADLEALAALAQDTLGPDDEIVFSESLLGRDLVRYSVAFCRARHACLAFEAIKERPSATTGMVGTYVTLADAPEARAIALRAAEALDFYGMGEMEIFLDRSRNRYYAIEINARPWLQLGMETLAGCDFVGFLAGRSQGTSGDRRPGAAWVDVIGDLFWRYSRTSGQRATGDASYLRSLVNVRSFKYFTPQDPVPAMVEAARWIGTTMLRRRSRRDGGGT
jgi:predicted ATP-grasp superfamily ATP-dependent carboligase